jgi:hypothetical protein
MRKVLVLTTLAVFGFAFTAMAANNLTVTGSAALDGSYGLSVNIDGSDNLGDAYVVSDHPSGETVYRFSFKIHPGTLDMDVGAAPFRYFLVGDGSMSGGTPPHFLFVYLMKAQSGLWRLQVNARQDDASFKEWDLALPLCDSADPNGSIGCNTITSIPIQVEWAASSAPGANDGYLKVGRSWDDGASYTSYIDITGLDNDEYVVDAAWFGAIFMANGTHNNPVGSDAAGSYYFDSFESYRTAAP